MRHVLRKSSSRIVDRRGQRLIVREEEIPGPDAPLARWGLTIDPGIARQPTGPRTGPSSASPSRQVEATGTGDWSC